MNTIRSLKLLDSVVSITAESDREHFRRSLSNTVRELLQVEDVTFLRPLSTGPAEAGALPFQELYYETARQRVAGRSEHDERPRPRPEHVMQMVRQGHYLEQEEQRATLLLPVLIREALTEIVVLRAPTITGEALAMLRGFTRLYRNFIALIAEGERDPLTGLLNRRVLDTRLAEVAREHARRQVASRPQGEEERRHDPEQLAHFIAVLDIDRFKQINDTFGHLFGDEVILLVAQTMREVFRDEDMLFRYGGEEFVVIISAESRQGALAALERCRERIAARRFPQLNQVTVSGGLAEMRGRELPAAVIARADQALYCAKDDGRNRVYCFDELHQSGRLGTEIQNNEAEIF